MSDQNLNPNFNSNIEDEISLKDIVDFIIESWKVIFVTGVIGIIGATGYIFVTPNQYEATAQIQMAQLSTGGIGGTNLEDPNLLIARMKMPSSYDQAAIAACGYEGKPAAARSLSNMAKLSIPKGTQMVELKVRGLSSEQATQCAESILRIIRDSQKAIAEPIIDEAKAKLLKFSQLLQEAQSFIVKADKSSSAMTAAYLSTRDQIKFLTDETIRLNDLIVSNNSRQTKLISPIYSPENKASPKRVIALITGLFAGLILGLVLMLGQRVYRAYKTLNSK
jgi:uncharacterized protein involved in exopolysaccharide biosynthesis